MHETVQHILAKVYFYVVVGRIETVSYTKQQDFSPVSSRPTIRRSGVSAHCAQQLVR